LFSFFLDKGIVTPAQGRAKGGVVRIDEDTAKTIESGTILSVLLGRMGHADKLQAIETKTNNAMTRLQNWNVLVPVLKRYAIQIPPDQKALLIAADTGALLKLYEEIRTRLIRRQVGETAISNTIKANEKANWVGGGGSIHKEKRVKNVASLDQQARTRGLASFGHMRIKQTIVEDVEKNPTKALDKCNSLMEVCIYYLYRISHHLCIYISHRISHHLCIYRISHHLYMYICTYHIHHITSPMYITLHKHGAGFYSTNTVQDTNMYIIQLVTHGFASLAITAPASSYINGATIAY